MRFLVTLFLVLMTFSAKSDELSFNIQSIEGITLKDGTYVNIDEIKSGTEISEDIQIQSDKIVINKTAFSKIGFFQLGNGLQLAPNAIVRGGDMGGGGL